MKIGLVHKQFALKGGTEMVLYRTAEGLRDRGHEVHLFCGQYSIPPPPRTAAHSVPCIRWPRTARLLTFAYFTPRVMDRYPCAVIMSFHPLAEQDLFRSGGGPHRVYIQKMSKNRGLWRRFWYWISPYHRSLIAIEKRQMQPGGCRKIITVHQQGKKEMLDTYWLPEEKVGVIHNGVDHERFHPGRRLKEGKKIRESLGIPLDRPVVIFVGTGFRRKGLDRLLRIWGSDKIQGVYLLVVGDDARLRYYRRRWSGNHVIFVGPQLRVEDYYAAADLLVLPTIHDAFGNVVLEALSSGLPVVTVAGLGSTDQLNGDLTEGILTDPDDPEELQRRILRQLDKSRWASLSRAARQVAEKYSWAKYFKELEMELKGLARDHVSHPETAQLKEVQS